MTRAVFACVTLVLAATLAARGEDTPPPKVTVAAPVEQTVTSYLEATGKTAAVNSVDLVARVQGFLQEINYIDGAFVKKGRCSSPSSRSFTVSRWKRRSHRSPPPRPS